MSRYSFRPTKKGTPNPNFMPPPSCANQSKRNRKIAKCYGIWGWKYYRTEDGETYSIKQEVCGGKTKDKLNVFYYGNAKKGTRELRILTEEEYKQIKFVD